MSAQDQALKIMTEVDAKPVKSTKSTPCADKTTSIHETLTKIQEQIDIFPEFYERMNRIEMEQKIIVELLTEISVMLKGRVDVLNEMDKKELEVMDALLAKMK